MLSKKLSKNRTKNNKIGLNGHKKRKKQGKNPELP